MSRYGSDYGGNRREPERWDHERFNRERGGRQAPIIERDIYEEHDRYGSRAPPPRRAYDDHDYLPQRPRERVVEKDRMFEEERYGPPAKRAPRQERFYDEDEIDSFESSPDRGGRVEERRISINERKSGGRAPPRPGQLIRRQSSLDTFDRKPLPRYSREPPEVISMPGPRRRHRSPPRYERERDFEDIRIAEPDYYGDDEYRGWKEREIITNRRRRPQPEFEERFEEREEIIEEAPREAPFPRRGKTKMPSRLVNERAIIELGYPFERDGDKVIILKALSKELIDEVIERSKEMNGRSTYMIEAPPRRPEREDIIEYRETVIPPPPEEVPRSVREWDLMSGAAGGGHGSGHGSEHGGHKSTHGGKSHKSKSHHGGHSTHKSSKSHKSKSHHESHSHKKSESGSGSESSSSSGSASLVIEKRHTRSKSRNRSKSVSGALVEDVEYSNKLHTGPLALVLPHREKERDERSIKAEIKELEAEKKRLERERSRSKYRRDDDEVIIERRDRRESDVKIEKDRKGPNARMVKAMLGTLT